MLLEAELIEALVQCPATPTTNPGMGAGPQHVVLRVFKELLSHPSQPTGHLCAVSFVYLASTFGDWLPETGPLIV